MNLTRLKLAICLIGVFCLSVLLYSCSSDGSSDEAPQGCLPIPAPEIIFTANVESGANIVLEAPEMENVTYSWSGPQNFTSSLRNPVITNASISMSGVYTLKITKNSCESDLATANVNVYCNPIPMPVISGPAAVNLGNAVQLDTDAVGADITYNWTGPGGFSSNLRNPAIPTASSANAGVYTLVIRKGECESAPATVNLQVVAPAIACTLPENTIGSTNWVQSIERIAVQSFPYSTTFYFEKSMTVSDIFNGYHRIYFTGLPSPVPAGTYTDDHVRYEWLGYRQQTNSIPGTHPIYYVDYNANGKMVVKVCDLQLERSSQFSPATYEVLSMNLTEN